MGVYAEKRDKLIERIQVLEKHISDDTAKKKELEEKLKEVSRLAMAEEYNCKPRELDDIINSEHTLLQKLRASGLSDSELLEMVGITAADNSTSAKSSDSKDGTEDGDDFRFYDKSDSDDD